MAKTKNCSIRFDEDNFNFVCNREGIESAQKLIDFLLSEYCKLYRIEKESVYEIKEQSKNLYDSPPLKNIAYDEPKQWQEPKQPINQFYAYQTEIKTTTLISQLENIIREVKKDFSLTSREKLNLEQLAKQHSIDNDFYTD